MLHQKIKEYIIAHKDISLAALSSQFALPPQQMRSFLDMWVKSGSLQRKEAEDQACKKGNCACNICIVVIAETYSWIGK